MSHLPIRSTCMLLLMMVSVILVGKLTSDESAMRITDAVSLSSSSPLTNFLRADPQDASERANATFYTYIPNVKDTAGLLKTVKSVEQKFNMIFGYDWVFSYYNIYNEPFPEGLLSQLQMFCSGQVIIQEIPQDSTFNMPEGIDKGRIQQLFNKKTQDKVSPNQRSISYKLKTRFHTLEFVNLPALQNYKYYCNVDIETELLCDVNKDFFKFIQDNEMLYGFANAPVESKTSAKSIFNTYLDFLKEAPLKRRVDSRNMMDFTVKKQTGGLLTYSNCNFDSNFEVVDLSIFKTKEYQDFVHFFDNAGGIFYERWTDYNVKTLYITSYIPNNKIFWIGNIGYFDAQDRQVCSGNLQSRMEMMCVCDPEQDYSFGKASCLRRFFDVLEMTYPAGLEMDKFEIEEAESSRRKTGPLPDGQSYEPKYRRQKIREPGDRPFDKIYKSNEKEYLEKFMQN